MKQLVLFAFVVSAMSAGAGACAQSIEASRYVNRDGIEVIQARPQADTEAAGSVVMTDAAPKQTRAAKAPSLNLQQTVQVMPDRRMQVSASEQRARDKDRLTILNQELYKELAEFETKNKVLKTPSMRGKLPEAELARLRELASDHEKNIRALMAEISGVRK